MLFDVTIIVIGIVLLSLFFFFGGHRSRFERGVEGDHARHGRRARTSWRDARSC
jgi:hypothetical protein